MNAKKPPETESFDAAELGAMMREMRENLGHELDSVARDLRIRLVYLEAIESGRLSDLPGNAYVSGFLRSYSDFLGLEGDEIVRRFKMAGAEISNQPQLHLPSPVEEGRLPTASILLVAAVIAAAAYGGWYYLSGTGKGPMETIANLPKELSGLVDEAKNQTAPTEVAKSPTAPEAASDTGGSASQASEGASSEAAVPTSAPEAPNVTTDTATAETRAETTLTNTVVAVESAAESTITTGTPPVAPPTTPTAAPAVATTPVEPTEPSTATQEPVVAEVAAVVAAEPVPVAKPDPKPVEQPVVAAVAAATPAAETAPEPVAQAPLPTPAPAVIPDVPATVAAATPAADNSVRTAAVASTPRPDPAPRNANDAVPTVTASRTASETSSSSESSVGGVRIVVRATADSYVAVRTGDNQPLFSQLMRRGDSYEVPSGADLILETGNAGGLQITVGGKRAPSLGPTGEIRRNIPLDAEKLLSGIN